MFRERPTDVVCVSTWPPSHLEVSRAALALPLKGILVEKPLGDTWAAGRGVLDAVRAKGVPMAVPHGLRFLPHSRRIVERVRDGEIGQVRVVMITCAKWDILNAGIHWLNYALWLTEGDPPARVTGTCDARTRTYRDALQVETAAATVVETAGGARIVMQTGDETASPVPGKGTVFQVFGTKGSIEFYAWEPRYRVFSAREPAGREIGLGRPAVSHHQMALESLADAMDAGRVDLSAGEASLAALELCEAAYVSSRHRCEVRLPLSTFAPPDPVEWDPGRPYGGTGGGRDGRKV
jgi:predicted dehydrogenase